MKLSPGSTPFHLLAGPGELLDDARAAGLMWDFDRLGLSLQASLLDEEGPAPSAHTGPLRGTARDAAGNRYWLEDEGRSLAVSWRPWPLWTQPPDEPALTALAVSAHHLLVAGLEGRTGLLVFNLLDSTLQPVVHPVPLVVADLAVSPDGTLWLLGQAEGRWCCLGVPQTLGTAEDPACPPVAIALEGGNPVAVEVLPDATLLVLEPDAILIYRNGERIDRFALAWPEGLAQTTSFAAADLLFVPARDAGQGALKGLLYTVPAGGVQAFALELVADSEGVQIRWLLRYVPLPGGCTERLLAVGREAYVHTDAGGWHQLAGQAPWYQRTATALYDPLDGKDPSCTWDRLYLDAALPPGTALRIETAVSAEPRPDGALDWVEQPVPYLRPDGAEQPGWAPFSADELKAGHTGTWETYLHHARGRYLHLRLTFSGNGRRSPLVRAIRAIYPRRSVVVEGLPAVYQADQAAFDLLDRYLANPTSTLADLARRVADVRLYMDPYTVPAEYLPWLSQWLGVMLQGDWDLQRRRLFLAHAMELYGFRGTVPGLVWALRLALEPRPDDAIFTLDVSAYTDPPEHPHRQQPLFRVVESAGQGAFSVVLFAPPGADERSLLEAARPAVEANRPAHTLYTMQVARGVAVGEARVGVTTLLANPGAPLPLLLGRTLLGRGLLAGTDPTPPATAAEGESAP
jgi:phage tail-like protein